jgi:hypothetical protein
MILDGGIVICGGVAEEEVDGGCSGSLGALGLSRNKTTKGNKYYQKCFHGRERCQ